MADKKSDTQKAAEKRGDPSIRSRGDVPEYPEGTHPVVSPSDATWGVDRYNYADMPDDDKPDPSSIVQTVEDPLEDENQDALDKQAGEGEQRRAQEAKEQSKK